MRVIKVLSALCVAILVMGGCDILDPNPPRLIYPEEGEVFTVEAPTFEWSSRNRAVYYKLSVYGDSALGNEKLLYVSAGDNTLFEMPADLFQGAPPGTYYWNVSSISEDGQAFWSDKKSFVFEKSIPDIDFDTTYFPYGLDYTWVYDYYYASYWRGDGGEYYDTSIYTVTDSVFDERGYTFTLSVTGREGMYETTEKIFGILGPFKTRIPVVPKESENYGIGVNYSGDTLYLSDGYYESHEPAGGHGYTSEDRKATRLRGIGKVYSTYSYCTVGGGGEAGEEIYTKYSLLYFIKGEDTVWRCDSCP